MLLQGKVRALSKHGLCIVSFFYYYFLQLNVSMVAWKIIFLYIAELREASKLFPVLFLLINIEINLQYTHTHPNSVSNKPTNQPALIVLQSRSWLLSNGEPDSSCSALHGSLHPSTVKLEFDPKSPTSVGTSLLTWCLGIERGMRWKNWSSFSGNFFPRSLREVEECFSSLSSLKE